MLHLGDLTRTLLLILGLGLVLLLLNGRMRWAVEGFSDDAIPCGENNPCSVGLKCINNFCAKTERLMTYSNDSDRQVEAYGPMPLN
jgi:hypothetical protein